MSSRASSRSRWTTVRGAQLPPGRARRRRCQHERPVRRQADVEGDLVDGRYTFQCDPHVAQMGAPSPSAPAPSRLAAAPVTPPPNAKPSAPVGARLALTVGPGATISLRRSPGRRSRCSSGRATRRARPVGQPQRSAARCGRGEVDRRRLRRDADVARGAAKRHARRPVRPAQGDDEAGDQGRLGGLKY